MTATILLDVDGVLADFRGRAAMDAEKLGFKLSSGYDLHYGLPEGARASLRAMVGEPGWCRSIEPYPGAVNAVEQLRDCCNIYFVTQPWPSHTWESDRRAWLVAFFPILPYNIISCFEKSMICGDVFIDDLPTNVRAWRRRQKGAAFLWHQPHNELNGSELDRIGVDGWRDDVVERIIKAAEDAE